MTAKQESSIVFGITRKSLEGTIIHACPKCEAPGVYRNDARTQEKWPGCYDRMRNNRPVGDRCPNCGAQRRRDKNLGELTASMPRWIWQFILGFKWCVIKLTALKRRTGERYG